MEELVDAFVYPVQLTPRQQKAASRQLQTARAKSQAEMSDADRQYLRVRALRISMEEYLKLETFDPKQTFGAFLRSYVMVLDKRQKDFAQEIGITEAELSQLVNAHRSPSESIIIRLEIHSKQVIPAIYWYKLVTREKEFHLTNNKGIRKLEKKHVVVKLAS